MRAMILHQAAPAEQKPLRLVELDVPQPQTGQIRVKVQVCGVCHTDLHIVEGDLPLQKRPIVPGHQVVGTIDALGAGVDRFTIGDRVGLAWLGRTCGQCEFCASQRENLCGDGRFTGWHADGGYAEYVTADADFAYTVPENLLPEKIAPLMCAGIIGYRALKVARASCPWIMGETPMPQRLGLYGFGASAHIAIQIARYWNCEVYVFSRTAEHRKLAEQLGATWTGGIEDELPARLHGSVMFAPAGKLIPSALAHLEKGGALALAGIYMSEIPPLDYEKHLYHERRLCSVANSTRADGRELLTLAGQIGIQTQTQTYPLEQANEALQDMKQSRINGAAILQIA